MFERYAVYFTPDGALGEAGASWLGWDVARGCAVPQPAGAAEATETPRRYGFHATMKPPFVLADGRCFEDLEAEFTAFCAKTAPVSLDGLLPNRMGRFWALTPDGRVDDLNRLAAETVRQFDSYRAPPTQDELARRRKARLSPAQEENLIRWGYPHVMEQFRFHITLTSRLKEPKAIADAIDAHFKGVLPRPFTLDHLTLAGQRPDGMFQQIARQQLAAGQPERQ